MVWGAKLKMKKKFSTKWKSSKQPRKQKKYIANAPLHLKRKLLSVNLSKELRKKYGIRNVVIRKGDKIRIMRGKFKKKQGKALEIRTNAQKIIVEGIQIKKTDGSKANVPLKASNLQIIELNTDDRKRKLGKTSRQEKKKTKEEKPTTKPEVKKTESKEKK